MQADPIPTIAFRLDVLERVVQQLKDQLNSYVPVRENDLQLRIIRETVERTEKEVNSIKIQIEHEEDYTKHQLGELTVKINGLEIELRERDSKQRENQNKLQIQALSGIVGSIIFLLSSIIIAYITHILH